MECDPVLVPLATQLIEGHSVQEGERSPQAHKRKLAEVEAPAPDNKATNNGQTVAPQDETDVKRPRTAVAEEAIKEAGETTITGVATPAQDGNLLFVSHHPTLKDVDEAQKKAMMSFPSTPAATKENEEAIKTLLQETAGRIDLNQGINENSQNNPPLEGGDVEEGATNFVAYLKALKEKVLTGPPSGDQTSSAQPSASQNGADAVPMEIEPSTTTETPSNGHSSAPTAQEPVLVSPLDEAQKKPRAPRRKRTSSAKKDGETNGNAHKRRRKSDEGRSAEAGAVNEETLQSGQAKTATNGSSEHNPTLLANMDAVRANSIVSAALAMPLGATKPLAAHFGVFPFTTAPKPAPVLLPNSLLNRHMGPPMGSLQSPIITVIATNVPNSAASQPSTNGAIHAPKTEGPTTPATTAAPTAPTTSLPQFQFRLTFEHLPENLFDTATLPMHKLVCFTMEVEEQLVVANMYFVVSYLVARTAVNPPSPALGGSPSVPLTPTLSNSGSSLSQSGSKLETKTSFVEIETRRLSLLDALTFGKNLFDKLPASKSIYIRVCALSTASNTLLTEATSGPVSFIHDGLKDSPAQITLDVCFFPQKVVTVYMKNCKSKATISKRHKKGLLKNGSTWCRNPQSCEAKGQCSCQAYPQRSIKKGIRKLKRLLERQPSAPEDVSCAAAELYAKLADTADEQIRKLPNYNSFLSERISRLELFMVLKEHAECEAANSEVRTTMESIWKLMSQVRTPPAKPVKGGSPILSNSADALPTSAAASPSLSDSSSLLGNSSNGL